MSRKVHCAIYTRKSSEEGLDQNFNSLDAQHEACAAYVASQRGEGWHLLPTCYDDGGVSGGTLERPALTRLMAEVDAGRINMVVVHKIDRLTRSLSDFAKLIDRFDAAGCSFVSVTQSFNTSSSMGRLTLNMLLSFAQFERELTAERIRDKIAASKKRGLWMGGVPPLGYDPHPDPKTRSLVVNEAERGTVKALYELYDRLNCLRAVEQEAQKLGLRSKSHRFSTGRVQGGGSLSRGQIHHILCNPIYAGRIRHKEMIFEGQHDAIIDSDLWARIQEKLQKASARPRGRLSRSSIAKATARTAVLTGKIRDDQGDRLTPTHTKKGPRRIRYYVSNRLLSGSKDKAGWRLPAGRFEAAISRAVARHLLQSVNRHTLLSVPNLWAGEALATRVRSLCKTLKTGETGTLSDLVVSGRLEIGRIMLILSANALAALLDLQPDQIAPDALELCAPFAIRRCGVETKIVVGEPEPDPDATLLRGLAKAHEWAADVQNGVSVSAIAQREQVTTSYIRPRLRLAFLSPRLQSAILLGRQPSDLTLERLVRMQLPLEWLEQENLLGYSKMPSTI